MHPAAPHRTHQQRMDALATANKIRVYRAQVKRDVTDGARFFPHLRRDPQLATAKVAEFLVSVPKIGACKASSIMRTAGVSPSKTFGGITDYQWAKLLTAFRGNAAFAHHQHQAHQHLATERTAA